MRIMIVGLAFFCFVALLAGGVSAQEKIPAVDRVPPPAVPSTGTDQRIAQVPVEILFRFVDEPSHHFGLAQEDFLKKDYAQSAAEIRKSAGFVKLEMARSMGEGQSGLADVAIQLEKLAGDIESKSVKSVDEINMALARAEQALAAHHESKAEEYWRSNYYMGVGQDLKAASMNLKNSLKYSGERVDVETGAAIKNAHEIGQNLIDGTKLADERIGAALEALSDKIDEAGTKLEQPKK
jgi:hypothetical protein